jgi:hypothetical protein
MNDAKRFQVCDEEEVMADFATKEGAFAYIESYDRFNTMYVYDTEKDEVIFK